MNATPIYLVLGITLLVLGCIWIAAEVRAMDRARARQQEPRPMEPDQIRDIHQRIHRRPTYEQFAGRLERRVESKWVHPDGCDSRDPSDRRICKGEEHTACIRCTRRIGGANG